MKGVIQALKSCGVPYRVLSASDANKTVPQLNIPQHYECILEEDGGILSAQSAVETLQV